MKKITCDKCGVDIPDGCYREIRTNVIVPVPTRQGICISDCVHRVPGIHDLCSACSREFDYYFDKCVAEFLKSEEPTHEN